MARMDRIVEVDAGEDGEDVGLQEGDQEFERGEATVSPSGKMAPIQPIKPRAPSVPTKLANTFSAMWPASMLAKSRSACETGFTKKNAMISISTTSGRM